MPKQLNIPPGEWIARFRRKADICQGRCSIIALQHIRLHTSPGQHIAVATDRTLVWNNEDFDERNARFGADSKGIVYGIYSGSMPSNYTTVTLTVMDSQLSNFSTKKCALIWLIYIPYSV